VNDLKKYTNLANGVSQLSEFFLKFYKEFSGEYSSFGALVL